MTPTDYRALCAELCDDLEEWVDGFLINDPPDEFTAATQNRINRARAALSQPEPEVVGPSDKEVLDLADDLDLERFEGERSYPDSTVVKEGCWEAWDHQLLAFARAILQRYGTPQPSPVPVAERPWERNGWCNLDGEHWLWDFIAGCWFFLQGAPLNDHYTHCLPHNALPVPGAEVVAAELREEGQP